MNGILYIVATPIGNLGDISYRAIETLNSVDQIACEDTRHSLTLLNKYQIKKPLVSYHKFNEREAAQSIVHTLMQGKSIALISDAGTPLISDPGFELVKACYQNGITVSCIGGSSALINAAVLSGIDCRTFLMLGFLPSKKSEAKKFLQKYCSVQAPLIVYCAPHDLKANLSLLCEVLGNRKLTIARELTKKFEEVFMTELKLPYPKEPKGEYVLVIEGADDTNPLNELDIRQHVEHYMAMGESKNDAIKLAAKDRNVAKSEVYKAMLD